MQDRRRSVGRKHRAQAGHGGSKSKIPPKIPGAIGCRSPSPPAARVRAGAARFSSARRFDLRRRRGGAVARRRGGAL
eukprot:1743715-Prymnesium_polylepis.1